MRRAVSVLLFLLCALTQPILFPFIFASDAQSGNSPWPMFGHDNKHTGRSPYVGYQTNSIKWIYDPRPKSDPIIGIDGTVYFGASDPSGKDAFVALNPDGTLKWKYILPAYESARDSAPAIDSNGRVYFQSSDYFYALNPDGSLKWRNGWAGSSPTIDADGTIYVGTNATLVALNSGDGSIKWRYDLYSSRYVRSPVIGSNGDIYFSTSGKSSELDARIYCLSSSGSFKWAKEIEDASAPSIASDGTIYVAGTGIYAGSGGYYLYAFNPDGSQKWKYSSLGNYVSSDAAPAIGPDGTIYIGPEDKNLYAINPNGTLKFKFPVGGWIESSPAIDVNGTIYFGSDDKNFYALNPDGTLKWKYKTISMIRTSPAIAADGTIYTGDQDLYAFGPLPTISVTVSGKVQYENRPYNETGSGPDVVELKPVRFSDFEIVRVSDQQVLTPAETETKADGTYEVTVNVHNGDELFLRCYANQENSNYNIKVVDNQNNKHSAVSSNMQVTTNSINLNLDIAEAQNAAAFNILDTLMQGSDKVKALSGSVPQLITVKWQKGISLGTQYDNNTIELNGSSKDSDEYDDTVILHEYGHFIADKYSYDKSPGSNHGRTDTNQDIRLSWSEGWATFLPGLVRNNPVYVDTGYNDNNDLVTLWYNFDNLDSDSGSLAPYAKGQDTEVSVSSILWDIYDSGNDSGDNLSLGAQSIWDVFDNYIDSDMDCVLEDFYNGWFDLNGELYYKTEINNIFSERKVFYSTSSFKRGKILTKIEGAGIPKDSGQSLSSTVSIPDNLIIFNLNVFVETIRCDKTYLVVKLISPSNKEVVLHNLTGARFGQSYDIFSWYQPPYETIPDEGLSVLDKFKGDNAQGDWILNIMDTSITGDTGILNRWKLEIIEDLPPEFTPIGDKVINEGKLLEFTIQATEPNNQTLTYSATNLPQGALFIPERRLFSWLPNYNQQGEHIIHFEVTDGTLKDFEDINITVNDVVINPASGKSVSIGLKVRVVQ